MYLSDASPTLRCLPDDPPDHVIMSSVKNDSYFKTQIAGQFLISQLGVSAVQGIRPNLSFRQPPAREQKAAARWRVSRELISPVVNGVRVDFITPSRLLSLNKHPAVTSLTLAAEKQPGQEGWGQMSYEEDRQ